MFSIRTTQTSSSATAVQIVRYHYRQTVIVKHIGSAHTPREVLALKQLARDWIRKHSKQLCLLPVKKSGRLSKVVSLNSCQYLGFRHGFIYQVFKQIFHLFHFDRFNNQLFLDLVLIRIIEPTSKLRSLQLLHDYFGIKYSRSLIYRQMPLFSAFKENVEAKMVNFAKKHLNFDFSLLFYDVTTLYFETFTDDQLRKCGFSKDNKFNQPQILIGLMINSDGFPLAYEIFNGSKFEGHTLLPAILRFKHQYQIANLTVVADAAMISLENITQLLEHKLDYIVGARLGNIPLDLVEKISHQLNKEDKKTIRLLTPRGLLICDFSRKRYSKDKYEMQKQIQKAVVILKQPAKIMKRCKFIKQTKTISPKLNQKLIEKTKLLLGLKGYYTNLAKQSNKNIISHYRHLWQIERSFRIAKSDLQIRPVYHWKTEAIQAHVLICFAALGICKYMEVKTGKSTQKIIQLLKSVTDARILDKVTNEEITMRSEVSNEIKQILNLMGLSY